MPKAKGAKPKPDDPEQSRRFEEAARELAADDSGAQFKRAIGVVVVGPGSPPKRRVGKKHL